MGLVHRVTVLNGAHLKVRAQTGHRLHSKNRRLYQGPSQRPVSFGARKIARVLRDSPRAKRPALLFFFGVTYP